VYESSGVKTVPDFTGFASKIGVNMVDLPVSEPKGGQFQLGLLSVDMDHGIVAFEGKPIQNNLGLGYLRVLSLWRDDPARIITAARMGLAYGYTPSLEVKVMRYRLMNKLGIRKERFNIRSHKKGLYRLYFENSIVQPEKFHPKTAAPITTLDFSVPTSPNHNAWNSAEKFNTLDPYSVGDVNRVIYDQSGYAQRLEALVTSSNIPRQPLYVAIGSGDFVSSWLPRLIEKFRRNRRAVRVSSLTILSLAENISREMEANGELAAGFSDRMLNNIEALKNSFLGPFEWRVWQSHPVFHGYVYSNSALVGNWARSERGHLDVMTSLEEIRTGFKGDKFDGYKEAFRNAKCLYKRS
jgi:hypothetical protein